MGEGVRTMNYIEQLNTPEWRKKRLAIANRDNNQCQVCNNQKLLNNYELAYTDEYNEKKHPHLNKFILTYHLINSNGTGIVYIDEVQKELLKTPKILYIQKGLTSIHSLIAIRNLTSTEKQVFEQHRINNNLIIQEFSFDFEKTFQSQTNSLIQKRRELSELIFKETVYNFIYVNGLHIHHKYYVKNLLAWEYPDEALITLCFDCHENLHKDQTIPVYENTNHLAGEYHFCKRCHGTGRFPEYSHIQSGICFECNGERYMELT